MLNQGRCKRFLCGGVRPWQGGGSRLTTRARILQRAFALSATTSAGVARGQPGPAEGRRVLGATRATSSSARDNRPLSKETHQEEDEKEGKTFLGRLKVLTFNLLAPCYFRSDGIYESTSMTKTMKRHKCIIEVLREQRCDVCCLQEFWFNDYLRDLYQEELGHLYSISSLQRTRSEDGVAILMLKEKFHVVNQHDIYFREHSKFGHDRVALVVLAQMANMEGGAGEPGSAPREPSAAGKCSSPMAFVTSHLTYPHHTLDEYSRLEQAKVMVGKSKQFVEGSCPPGTPIVISGDFNGTLDDQVSNQMRVSGYLDAFSEATGAEQSIRRITHCDHRKNQKGVDYIWMSEASEGRGGGGHAEPALDQVSQQNSNANAKRDPGAQSKLNMLPFDVSKGLELRAEDAYLLPRDVPCDMKMHRPKFGKKRAQGLEADDNMDVGYSSLGEESDFDTGKWTLNSLDSYDNVEDVSFASGMDWKSWCNLSDHRPMVVHFDVYSTEKNEGES
ncbi:endo/exonuclease/phosphatase domain-containing protein [Chloropicon primus]|uniref:Endonuclease/exonuclease/phosphatase domain-containing protein n=1 Tax=Chloropicon primus TaxID=1764295 RepID=A0A5B8MUL4_9CHLO|nr:hypothetical protein A3770_10p58430 [Chloropicon primus]UPR02537.1 endo/exonuclease/phosphatase domain-containing protein [Chloropicon primus]|mmetsp:Transcript_9530/g.27096  ORF Transcript_9530/g.27096 Transcript_9530/m.27096 type:complete len:503 (+) Transcript_9530:353-1861(+)|eukprot:QDZ23325.1 hypothetical protein A3770_10p58430 [Chloropicon primus]